VCADVSKATETGLADGLKMDGLTFDREALLYG
jgi:hypothetical protein